MTSASNEKWRPFNCFFQAGRAKDLPAPLYRRIAADEITVKRSLYSEVQSGTKSVTLLRMFLLPSPG